MMEHLAKIDTQLFLFLNGLNSSFWDVAMWHISGKYTWIPLYLLIIFFVAKRHCWQTIGILLAIALVVVLADQLSVHLFKNVFERLRPCHNPDIKELVHVVKRCGGKYGFVSSHAANSFGVAVFLVCLIRKRWFSIGILFWALLVSYSRIYISTIRAISLWAPPGSAIGFGIWKLLEYIDRKTGNRIIKPLEQTCCALIAIARSLLQHRLRRVPAKTPHHEFFMLYRSNPRWWWEHRTRWLKLILTLLKTGY